MRIGIIAEGFADANVIKQIVRKILSVGSEDIQILRPEEKLDETDLKAMNFSNWQLVMESCQDEKLLSAFFDILEGEAIIVVHVDTAERGNAGYDVNEPIRTGISDWKIYDAEVFNNVKEKLKSLIPEQFHDRIAYAIAVEETEAWIIPLFENRNNDSASHTDPKCTLSSLIGHDKKLQKKFVDTSKKSLDYNGLGKSLSKKLSIARSRNESLNLFCIDLERFKNP